MPCTAENPAAAAAHDAPRPRKEAVLSQICAQALAGQSCRQIAATFGLPNEKTSRTENRVGNPVFLAAACRALDGIAKIAARIARPGKVGVPVSDITAERDEYDGVPSRPGKVETPGQELSHAEPMADITAERDEYGAVPSRPGKVETPDQNCPIRSRWQTSRRSVMSTAVPPRPGKVETRAKTVPFGTDGRHHGGA